MDRGSWKGDVLTHFVSGSSLFLGNLFVAGTEQKQTAIQTAIVHQS